MHMVFDNSRSRSPRQHYVWSEKALSIVRSTRIPKKDGALVVQQLQALAGYPEKACWRLAERFGFRRPNARRVWSQEELARIIELSETTCIREIAKRFKTTTRTIYLKVYNHHKSAGHSGMIYTVSAIANLLKVTPSTVKQWNAEGRLEIQQQQRGSVTAYIVEDDEFERFCRDNLNYLIFMVGGRIAPRERILFLKQFVIAADMPDDHTARSHRREREAYAQLIDSEEMTN
jgi:transposase-like protein